MGLLDFLRAQPSPSVVAVEQKAMTGPGAYAMEFPSAGSAWWTGTGRWDTPRGMARAQALSHQNPWIDRAERLICGRASAMPWHLETGDDETVDDAAPESLRAIRDLLERPARFSKPDMTWRDLLHITYRHMGVINVGAWYLDALDPYGIPKEIFYLNPARLTPDDASGTLTGWWLDKEADYHGGRPRRLETDEVILFPLIPPDAGYFGVGLVETAEGKARLSSAADRFATQTYATGGRRGSWISPREGRMPDDVFEALVAGLKNIADSPDATKRNIVSKGAIDVTPQASTPQELQSSEIMAMSRDDLLVLWGVDVADAGVPGSAGLASGQLRAQARQSTYENGIEPRVDVLQEKVQLRLLDRWKELGITVELEIERPEWEDETPAYDRAAKAREIPLRNWERREILGLDPFGDPVLDNAVWLPAGISEAYVAPDKDGNVVAVPVPVVVTPAPRPQLMPGEDMPSKASPLGRTRATVEARVTPALRSAVSKALAGQREAVVALVRDKAAHLAAKPSDVRAIFNGDRFAAAMRAAIEPHLTATATTVATETKQAIGSRNPAKADPPTFLDSVTEFVLRRGGERIVQMGETTRDDLVATVKRVVTGGALEGLGPAEIADRLTDAVGAMPAWSDARAETIARTETMFAYNDAALGSYREYGVDRVEAIDGDEDTECAERNGQTFTLDEALGIVDHPNGTLDWLPVIKAAPVVDYQAETLKAVIAIAEREPVAPVVNVYNDVTTPDVHVTTPPVTVYPADAPVVNVTVPPAPAAKAKRIERDPEGRITGITEEPG